RFDFLPRNLEGFHHSFGIFPRIEPRNLNDQRQVGRNFIAGEPLIDLLVAELAVLNVEWIDRGHGNTLRGVHLVFVLFATHDYGVVIVDPAPEIFPHLFIRSRKIDEEMWKYLRRW